MKVEYKLLRLIADPFRGDKFTVGALLQDEQGVRFVQANTLPGAECLGSARTKRALDFVVSETSKSNEDWWTKLPVTITRFVEHSETRTLNVANPERFIRENVLPNFEKEVGPSRSPSLLTLGERYFSQFDASRFVKKNFPIQDYYRTSGYQLSTGLHTLGQERLVLIEPIFAERNSLSEDVRSVALRYQSWRLFEQDARTTQLPIELYVTILPGGDAERAAELVEESVGASMDKLFLMDSESDQNAILGRIEEVGASLAS
jgi:hypothetical protein